MVFLILPPPLNLLTLRSTWMIPTYIYLIFRNGLRVQLLEKPWQQSFPGLKDSPNKELMSSSKYESITDNISYHLLRIIYGEGTLCKFSSLIIVTP